LNDKEYLLDCFRNLAVKMTVFRYKFMLDVLGNLERTHSCGELRGEDVGQEVVLMGWVAKKRDFGIFTFIDLRDREGLTQIVVSEEDAKSAHEKAKNLRGEFVVAIKGEVLKREVVGISTDSAESHKHFAGKYDLPLTLLADENGETLEKYDMKSWLPNRAARGVVVIDKNGKIAYHKVQALSLLRPKDDKILQAIEKAQNVG
jgi:hypothetical protein